MGGGSKGGAPKGGDPKFRAFFSLFHRKIRSFSSLSGGLYVEFWWCLKRQGPEMCTFGVLGLSCANPARSGGAAGVSHDSLRAGKGGPGKGGPGKGTQHDQTKTLKPPHGNRENQHTHTHKHTQTHTNTSRSGFGQSRFWPKSVWPKSAMTEPRRVVPRRVEAKTWKKWDHNLAITFQREHKNLCCLKGVDTMPAWLCWKPCSSQSRWKQAGEWDSTAGMIAPPERGPLLSWTTFTLSPLLIGSVSCTTFCKRSCFGLHPHPHGEDSGLECRWGPASCLQSSGEDRTSFRPRGEGVEGIWSTLG